MLSVTLGSNSNWSYSCVRNILREIIFQCNYDVLFSLPRAEMFRILVTYGPFILKLYLSLIFLLSCASGPWYSLGFAREKSI